MRWRRIDPWEDEPEPPDPAGLPALIVTETDVDIVAVLYGPDGETPLAVITDRPVIPFGYQPPAPAGDGEGG